MASQPNAILRGMSVVILENAYLIIPLTFVHGVFVLLFCISTASFLRRGLGSCSSQAMLSLTIFSFTTATVYWAAGVASVTTQIQTAMVHNLEMPLAERLVLSNHEMHMAGIVAKWAGNTLPIISDGIVIWRVWVVFFDKRWVMIGPIVLWLATIATTLTFLVLNVNFDTYFAKHGIDVSQILYLTTQGLTVATNALSTLMVGYKLWVHRKHITNMLGREQRFTRAQNVLVILIESGMLYLVLQLTTAILYMCPRTGGRDSPEAITAHVFADIYGEVSGMYPLIVVVLVNDQRSFIDTYGLTSLDLNSNLIDANNASSQPTTALHLAFAPHVETTTESCQGRNDTNAALGVVKEGVENVEVNAEKPQAKTAWF